MRHDDAAAQQDEAHTPRPDFRGSTTTPPGVKPPNRQPPEAPGTKTRSRVALTLLAALLVSLGLLQWLMWQDAISRETRLLTPTPLVALAAALVAALGWSLRRQRRAEVRSRDQWREVHDLLEARVTARTAELITSNESLQREISERKLVEDTLRLSDETLRQLPDAILVTDVEGQILRWTGAAEEIFGYSSAEAVGRPVNFLHRPDERDVLTASIVHTISSTGSFHGEFPCLRKDGSEVPIETTTKTVFDAEGKPAALIGINRDITQRKRAEQAIRDSEQRFRATFHDAPIGKALATMDGRFIDVNQALCRLFGYSREELLATDFKAITHPDDLESSLGAMQPLLEKGTAVEIEKRYIAKDDRVLEARTNIALLRGPEGQPLFMLAQVQDVTVPRTLERELKKANQELERRVTARTRELETANLELRSTQAQLVQAGKLAAMGELGAGIAHELNQPLSAIQAFAEAMLEVSGDPQREEIDLIVEQCKRMARIVDNVRAFARKSGSRLASTEALIPLYDALMLVSEQLRLANVTTELQVEEILPPIRGDAVQLQQVFLNLISNALHALEQRAEDERGRRLLLRARRLQDEDAVEYAIEDNGTGVPVGTREQIFDPFFTTKPQGKGTGLGLSLSYGIVKEHGGELSYEPAAHGGARFLVRIPLAEEATIPDEGQPGVPDPGSTEGAGHILVVDDEAVLRGALSKLLERAGWTVSTVSSGRDALELLEKKSLDVALIDLKMPGMSGLETCTAIKDRWPALPLIAMSGYISDEDREHLVGLGLAGILPKPVGARLLRETVARAHRDRSPADQAAGDDPTEAPERTGSGSVKRLKTNK